jgi:hypothetical protein
LPIWGYKIDVEREQADEDGVFRLIPSANLSYESTSKKAVTLFEPPNV